MALKTTKGTVHDRLAAASPAILSRWKELVYATYPADTARMLKENGDRFDNPVGYTISHNLAAVLDNLILRKDLKDMEPYLEEIVRIRAVQQFTPDEAISFMGLLKPAISAELKTSGESAEMEYFEGAIDGLSEKCSDIYQSCRGKIDLLRAKEHQAGIQFMAKFSGTAEASK
jgi:hypothetical protein